MTIPKIRPDVIAPAQAQAVTPIARARESAAGDRRDDDTGHFEGAEFRHVAHHARRPAPARPVRRPMNRPPPSATGEDEELFELHDPALQSNLARRLVDRLDRGVTPDGTGGDDTPPDDEQRGIERRRAKARFRVLAAPQRAASAATAAQADAADHDAPPRAGTDAVRRLAQRALALIERIGGGTPAAPIRAALLAGVGALLEAPPGARADAANLAAVRAVLVDSTRGLAQALPDAQAAADLRCLLPILLLNLQRPRTAQQAARAAVKIELLKRVP